MTKSTLPRWDAAEEDHLLFLRDRERLTFKDIGPRIGRTAAACEVRYYVRLFAFNEARHYGRKRDLAPRPVPVAKPAKLEIPLPAEHGGYRSVNLDGLREWADLRARIAERGLTGGVFNDPPPGRSALDEHTRAAAAAAQRASGNGGSDVG
jgi:hypothetical protein